MKTFGERVVEAARSIPAGRVTTYGALARACGGSGRAAQSITAILARAHERGVRDIPFHRIVYANGVVWISEHYEKKRMALYKKEGIQVDPKGKIVDFADVLYTFS